jgi:hypothetical protein
VIAFDPASDDPDLPRTVSMLLGISVPAAALSTGSHQIATAESPDGPPAVACSDLSDPSSLLSCSPDTGRGFTASTLPRHPAHRPQKEGLSMLRRIIGASAKPLPDKTTVVVKVTGGDLQATITQVLRGR